jgi:hypothetical protein
VSQDRSEELICETEEDEDYRLEEKYWKKGKMWNFRNIQILIALVMVNYQYLQLSALIQWQRQPFFVII